MSIIYQRAEISILIFLIKQFQFMIKSQQRKQQFKSKQNIIDFNQQYPFNLNIDPQLHSLVRFTKYYQPQDYQLLKHKISIHSKLKHQSLIAIVKAFQSRKNKYFDIFYEYVPDDLTYRFSSLKKQEIQQNKTRLLQLCNFLISKNWDPIMSVSSLGINERGIIKYFLHFDTNQITSNKNQLLNRKKYQINQIFLQLSNQSNPNQQIIPQIPTRLYQGSNTSRSQESKQYKINFKYHSPLQRNSCLTHNVSLPSERVLINKIQNIDNRLKELGVNNTPHKQNRIFYSVKPSQQQKSPFLPQFSYHPRKQKNPVRHNSVSQQRQLTQKKNPVQIIHANQQDYYILNNSPQPKQSFYNYNNGIQNQNFTYNQKKYRRFDQQSVDTYHQELGQNIQMPKIMPHTQMRQTTNFPPKQYIPQKHKDKLHESVGFGQFRVIKSPQSSNEFNNNFFNVGYQNFNQHQAVNVPYVQKSSFNTSSRNANMKKKQDKRVMKQGMKQTSKSPEKSIKKSVTKDKNINNANNTNNNKKIIKKQTHQKNNAPKNQKQIIYEGSLENSNQQRVNQKDTKQIQQDFHKLQEKGKNKHYDARKQSSFIDQQKSRQYLYRYQNIFPECGIQEIGDDVSVRNAASLQNHLNQLYNQSLKFQNNDALVSQFNTLFECDATPTSSNSKRYNNVVTNQLAAQDPQRKPLKDTNSQEKVTKRTQKMNERIRQAFSKSQAALQSFSKKKR